MNLSMISRQDIENLATLSRIKLTEAEIESFKNEIGAILGYVADIQKASGGEGVVSATSSILPNNVFRDDIVTTEGGEYTEALLSAAPAREGNFLKVTNIF